MARIAYIGIAALTVLLVTGCQRGNYCPPEPDRVLSVGCAPGSVPLRLDRGDWRVSQRTGVSKVLEARSGRPPEAIGYLVERKYRQMRGGPEYTMYEVTTLNRQEQIGRIDGMGHAYRYEAQRDAGFEEIDEGVNPITIGVAAIFQTSREVFLEKTTERQLAFEALDRDGSGSLEPSEVEPHGDRLQRADKNRDGLIDFQEFDAVNPL